MVTKPFSRLFKIVTGVHTGDEGEFNRLERFAHLCVQIWKSFVRNRCLVRAQALSYITLLALIPLLAVAISVASSLLKSEGEDNIYAAVDKFVSKMIPPSTFPTNLPVFLTKHKPSPETALSATNAPGMTNVVEVSVDGTNVPAILGDDRVVGAQKEAARRIHDFVQNTRSGTLGTTGIVLLIIAAISLLGRIEETFNDMWGVKRGRSWLRWVELYCTTIMIGPLLLVTATGMAGGAWFQSVQNSVEQMPLIGGLVFHLLPLVVLWFAFALVYQLVPNTKVRFSAAFTGGVVGGTLWHLNNVFGFLYVSRLVTNINIYGGLGLVLVFMIGLYFSWVSLLFGAQVAYAFQNRKAYLQDKLIEAMNQRGREFIALRLMTCIGRRFQAGLLPAKIQEISIELGIPSRLAQQVLQTLLSGRLVTETAGAEVSYVPARPLETINAHHILFALRGQGQGSPPPSGPMPAAIYGEFARIEEAERQAASSVTVLDLVTRAHARREIAAPSESAPVLAPPEKPEPVISKAVQIQIGIDALAKDSPPEESIELEPTVSPTAPLQQPREKRELAVPEDDHDFPL